MSRSQLLIGLVAIAAVALAVAGYFVFYGNPATNAAAAAGPMSVTIKSDDRTLGSSKAPLTVLEYAAPSCPHCAHFDMDIFPSFKKQYIDTGKVFFVFRVFPLSAVDIAAEAMARCLPEDNYFQFLDLLYRNQAKWDPDGNDIPDVHAALVQMGKIEGMTQQQVDQCISNDATAKHIQAVATDATAAYGINSTPSFVINGQLHGPFIDFADLQSFIDPMLARK
jgi:protein-disulfide isomerase